MSEMIPAELQCPVCGQAVVLLSGDEGTHSYGKLAEERESQARELLERYFAAYDQALRYEEEGDLAEGYIACEPDAEEEYAATMDEFAAAYNACARYLSSSREEPK